MPRDLQGSVPWANLLQKFHFSGQLQRACACMAAQAAADVADINLDIHVDTVTASKIRELARAKVSMAALGLS